MILLFEFILYFSCCVKKNVFDNLDQAFGFFNQKTIRKIKFGVKFQFLTTIRIGRLVTEKDEGSN